MRAVRPDNQNDSIGRSRQQPGVGNAQTGAESIKIVSNESRNRVISSFILVE